MNIINGNEYLLYKLKNFLSNKKLPGKVSHLKLLPFNRSYYLPLEYKEASVVILLRYNCIDLHVLVIRRGTKDIHSNQIAFPGGEKEKYDKTLLDSALRELYEELGILSYNIVFLKELTPVFIPVSKYKIYPFLFFLKNNNIEIVPNKEEVNNFYWLKVDEIRKSYKEAVYIENIIAPAFVIQSEKIVIWGATAMVMNELLYLLKGFNL